ncbi:MAG: hypothetical protein IPK72_04835 [Candidatus Eisenbacteria bacterium]|nr:hypothetical protein [Candidatus Eisenbacteria bacterium]
MKDEGQTPKLIPSRRLRPPPAWLPMVAIAALLSLVTIALVLRPSADRGVAPELPPEFRARAMTRLGADAERANWLVVTSIETPTGPLVRLRPFVEGLELLGADLVLRADDLWSEAALTAREWTEARTIARSNLQIPLVLRPFAEDAWRFRLARGDDWVLEAEGLIDPEPAAAAGASREALRAAFRSLPWRSTVPACDVAIPVTARLDRTTGALIELRDARNFSGVQGSALVFDPNPVRVSGRSDLRDGVEVDGYRIWVPLEELEGSGRLRGGRIAITSQDPVRASEPGNSFAYGSRDPRFEEAMAYYHGHRSLARAEALGFRNLFRRPFTIVVHATALDNSWYSRPQKAVLLGDGGVDDAEDADVILHESGHALHDALVPGFGGGDTGAISEGFSDFWAASLTGDPCLAEWDATALAPPCLRRVDEPAVYPTWMTGQPHHDGEVWSALLWDLRSTFGAEATERLALAAFEDQSAIATYPQAAAGLFRAAERLGLDRSRVREAAARRGLAPLEVDAELAAGESRRIDLIHDAVLLDHRTRALWLDGDGAIRFVSNGRLIGAGPTEDPPVDPALRFCSPGPSSPVGLTRRLHATFADRDATFEETWSTNAEVVARVFVRWQMDAGTVEWTYLEGSGGNWSAGIDEGGAEVELDLRALADPRAGLGSFRGEVHLSDLHGARFSVSRDAEGFALRRLVAPIPQAATPELYLSPNPFRSRAALRLAVSTAGPADLAVYDASGRRLRTLRRGSLPAGVTWIDWDGSDDRGKSLPDGVYFVRAVTPEGTALERLTRLR